MSLPNYLAKIKSAGIYRFVWDKSTAPIQAAETLRLVVGYSEKGPFNTPVYIDNSADFKTIFGNISKRLEKKGVYFHRMALQALEAGPILALNLKKFTESKPAVGNEGDEGYVPAVTGEQVQYVNFDACDKEFGEIRNAGVTKIYDKNRFWALDPDVLPSQLGVKKYITIASTDSKETSCTLFLRQYKPTGYDVTVKSWYASRGEEVPSYLENSLNMLLEDTFAEVYVFRGQFTKEVATSAELSKYFNVDGDKVTLKPTITNTFNEEVDTLEALAEDECSNFLNVYRGTLLPYFKDNTNSYISLDLLFNKENSTHKMLMKLDQDVLEESTDVAKELKPITWVYEAGEEATTRKATAEEIAAAQAELDKAIKFVDVDKAKAIIAEFSKKYNNIKIDGTKITYFEIVAEATPALEMAITPVYLEGYTYSTISKSSTGQDIQNAITEVLTTYKGLRLALTNNIDIEYHYIVDTFRTYPGISIKGVFSSLAKEKDNCLAILNFPFMSDLTSNPQYIVDNTFKASKLKELKQITLPTQNEGASWCAFYTAMMLSDGTVKMACPSAAVVSNNFMEKYNTRQPYSIVAGPNHGLITATGLVGPDYNFSRADLDVFEPFGVNCLIYVPRVGTQINSNQTAKQSPVSALSKVHVRELVIYLQDSIAVLLQNYQWEFNTQTLRSNIKAKADKILENVQQNGGVYAFKNICDESNNTDDVINNEMLVLSTEIEPGMGAGKMVEELTIYRKGGMSSSAS